MVKGEFDMTSEIPPREFRPAFVLGVHVPGKLIHLGWVAQVGGLGTVTCQHCAGDNSVYTMNVSRVLGRDVTWDQFQLIIQNLSAMLAADHNGALPLDHKFTVGPFWVWYTTGYSAAGDGGKDLKPTWWLGFGDSAHAVDRMDVEAWLSQAEDWEKQIRETGWESIKGDRVVQSNSEGDERLEWWRRQMNDQESKES